MNCAVDKMQRKLLNLRDDDICNKLRTIISVSFYECYSNNTVIRKTISNCQNFLAVSNSIFAPEILAVKTSQAIAVQVSSYLLQLVALF